MSALTLVSHPLPVSWDGREVKWSRWESTERILICGQHSEKARCDCGSKRAPFSSSGLRAADPGAGRFARRHAVKDLRALRCPDCGQVDVWDMDSDEWWTLDDSDYGSGGSNAPDAEAAR